MILPPARFFAQPPTQAELDFTNPILKNIEHVISGNAAFLTKGKYNTSLRTGTNIPALIRRPSGLSYALGTGATVNLLATDAGEWVNSQTEWTMFTLSFWRGGSSNRAISTIAESPGASARDRSLAVSATAGGYFQVGTRDGATDVIVSSTTTVTTIGVNPFTLAGRATKAELSIFVNGVKEGASAITSTGRAYTSPELVLGQGALGTGIGITQICNSDPTIFLVWSRALSDEEIASLHRNPWQVYRSANRIVFPEAAAVTAYSLDTTPGTYNITGSSPSLLANRLVSTTPGAYDLTGSSPSLLLGRALDTTPGDYDITGSSPSLLLGRALETTPGDYDITGSPVDLEKATPGQFVLQTTPGAYNITGFPVELIANITQLAGGGPGKTAKRRGWANERARFEESLRTEEVAEQVKAAQRVLKKAQSESAQRLGELVTEYEAARASLDELREQVARIERESRIREEVEVASKVVEIFAREEEEIIAILEIIDEMDSRALLAAVGIAA